MNSITLWDEEFEPDNCYVDLDFDGLTVYRWEELPTGKMYWATKAHTTVKTTEEAIEKFNEAIQTIVEGKRND